MMYIVRKRMKKEKIGKDNNKSEEREQREDEVMVGIGIV
jgi:hypothetical protein